ncbi:hypothetical protein F5B20DRAFT_254914 [Whalleya microplaca]|nr:hypothetical protein F5B20DRAFT_254914 [Whalleya microplaca]
MFGNVILVGLIPAIMAKPILPRDELAARNTSAMAHSNSTSMAMAMNRNATTMENVMARMLRRDHKQEVKRQDSASSTIIATTASATEFASILQMAGRQVDTDPLSTLASDLSTPTGIVSTSTTVDLSVLSTIIPGEKRELLPSVSLKPTLPSLSTKLDFPSTRVPIPIRTSSIACDCGSQCAGVGATPDIVFCVQSCLESCPQIASVTPINDHEKRQLVPLPTLPVKPSDLLPPPVPLPSLPSVSLPAALPSIAPKLPLSGLPSLPLLTTVPIPTLPSLPVSIPGSLPSLPVSLPSVKPSLLPLPVPVPAPIPEAGSSAHECSKKCDNHCQSADIGFDVSQCHTNCVESCTHAAASGAGVIVPKQLIPDLGGLTGGGKPATPREGDVTALPAGTLSGPAVGAGSVDYDACLSDCNDKCQGADIGFPVTTCDSACKASCEGLSGSGSGVLPRQLIPDLGGLTGGSKPNVPADDDNAGDKAGVPATTPPLTGPAVGAGSLDYESCLSDCGKKCQNADIGFPVTQCDGHCKQECKDLYASGSGVLVPKQLIPDLGGLTGGSKPNVPADDDNAGDKAGVPVSSPPLTGPAVGAGSVDYESCLSDCGEKCQNADIGFPVSQCDGHCKKECKSLKAEGGGVIVPKQLGDLPVPLPSKLPVSLPPLPTGSLPVPLPSKLPVSLPSLPTSTRVSLLPTITSLPSILPTPLGGCNCGPKCSLANGIDGILVCVKECLAACPKLPVETLGPIVSSLP